MEQPIEIYEDSTCSEAVMLGLRMGLLHNGNLLF